MSSYRIRHFLMTGVAVVGLSLSSYVSAEIAIVVNKSVAATSITAEQVVAIFLGKSTSLPDGTKIKPIDQSEGERSRNDFYQKVVNKDPAQMNAYWSRLVFAGKGEPPIQVADDTEVITLVAGDAGVIGYVDAASVTGSVKVILTIK